MHQQLCSGFAAYQVKTKLDIIRDEDLNGKKPIPFFKKEVTLKSEEEMLPYYKV